MSSDPTHNLSRRAALLGLATLAGCGFVPVYGPGGVGSGLRNAVRVTTPETPEGYRLRTELVDRLGPVETPAYALTVTLAIDRESVAITSEGATTRYTLPGKADWVLTPANSEVVIAQGSETGFTSYAATGTTVSTRAAERDARDRLAIMLADQIVTRLMIAVGGA